MTDNPQLPFRDNFVPSHSMEKYLTYGQESENGSIDVPPSPVSTGDSDVVSTPCTITSMLWRFWNLIKLESHKQYCEAKNVSELDHQPIHSRLALRIKRDSMRHDRIVDSAQREIEASYNGIICGPNSLKEVQHSPRIQTRTSDIIESWI